MENASKALIMAGGVLIGILILSLIATLFISTKEVSTSYEGNKQMEAIQRFNTNFTQYVGQDLIAHQVVTICNFTDIKNNKVAIVDIEGTHYNKENIDADVQLARNKMNTWTEYYNIEVIYKLQIVGYDESTGYVSKIKIEEPIKKFKCYKKDSAGNTVVEYRN